MQIEVNDAPIPDPNQIIDTLQSQFDVWLNNQIYNNEFLIAGVFTVFGGALMYMLRHLPLRLYRLFLRTFTTTLTINTDNEHYHKVSEYINEIRIDWLQRALLLHSNFTVGPGYGMSFMFFSGTPLIVNRELEKSDSSKFKELLTLRFFSRSHEKIKSFVMEIKKRSEGENKIIVYNYNTGYWDRITERTPRYIENIFIPDEDKQTLLKRIDFFVENRDWYQKRGIPYKLGILLHGAPGCGKTSLIHAIASQYNRKIKLLNLNATSDSSIYAAFGFCEDAILVIEDIDTFRTTKPRKTKKLKVDPMTFEGKEEEEVSLGVSLSGILNATDGLPTTDGLIIIATTNHLQNLDPALTRKGRFDQIMEIGKLNATCLREMYMAFYGEANVKLLDNELAVGDYEPLSGADAQDIFINNSHTDAVKKLFPR